MGQGQAQSPASGMEQPHVHTGSSSLGNSLVKKDLRPWQTIS